MTDDLSHLDAMQAAYKATVESWITAIRDEEALASGIHSEANLDEWEGAHFREEAAREKTLNAKKEYEDALRKKFFDF